MLSHRPPASRQRSIHREAGGGDGGDGESDIMAVPMPRREEPARKPLSGLERVAPTQAITTRPSTARARACVFACLRACACVCVRVRA